MTDERNGTAATRRPTLRDIPWALKSMLRDEYVVIAEVAAASLLGIVLLALIAEVAPIWDSLTPVERTDRLTSLATVTVGIVALLGLELARRGADSARKQAARSDRHRQTTLKADLYAQLYVECDRHFQGVASHVAWREDDVNSRGSPLTLGKTEAAERAFLALELTTSPQQVLGVAADLLVKTQRIGDQFKVLQEEVHAGEVRNYDDTAWNSARDSWILAREAFREAARWDLWEPTEPVPPKD